MMPWALVSGLLGVTAAVPLVILLSERKRVRRELAENQQIIESAFASSASGMALLDLSGRWHRVNRALCEMTGYPEQELRKQSYLDLTYPDDLNVSQAQFQRLVAGEIDSYQLQKRYVHRSGHLFWALLTNSLVRDERGVPRYCVVHVQEITALKEEHDALALRERQMAKAQELARLVSWDWDLRSGVITWSEALFRIFGVDPADFVPRFETYLEFVHPEDRELIQGAVERAQRDHRSFSIEQRIRRRNGEQRILHVRGEAVVGPQGQAVRLRGSAQDVTESRREMDAIFRQAEEFREASAVLQRRMAERDRELAARDQMFQRIVHHVPAAIVYFDRTFSCQWMSPEALARFGIAPEAVSRLEAEEVPLFGQSASRFAAVMAGAEPYRETGVPLMLVQEGQEHLTHWDITLIPCRDPEGEPEGLLAFARDVTDRLESLKWQEQQIKTLELSEAFKDHFLNSLSHEIRSPLTVILGVALLFQGESLGPLTDKQRSFIGKLLRSGRELLRLVNNVLETNLVRSGRLELLTEPVAMEALIREAIAEFGEAVSQKGQQVSVEVEGDLPRVMADRRRLAQVWLNLVANAVQYAPEGARIIVRAWRDADRLCCEVFNTESEIPPSKLPDLFSALDHPVRELQGLGLGLGLSKALVEAHGGRIGAESGAEGVTLRFSLPMDSAIPETV